MVMEKKFLFLLLFFVHAMLSFSAAIKGIVVDVNGDPLIGVTIAVPDTDQGTITDVDGHYMLNIDEKERYLSFSYIGYQTQKIEIQGREVINVVLREATEVLEDVVVVGYGHQKKASITGSISTVPVKNILSVPVVTLSNAVGGLLQGVVTQQSSGEPGSNASILIRGQGTWSDSQPLVLVDGIERDINLVNPHDVESLSVLKDASATAIYGVRGANGVILINTKKGKAGKPQVTFRTEVAELIGTRFPDYIEGWEFASLMNEASYNSGNPNPWTEEEIQKFKDGSEPYFYPNVNWTDAVYRKTANQTINTLSISGGSEVVRYYLSARHTSESGLYQRDKSLDYNTNTRLNRFNLLSNIDVNVYKDLVVTLGLSSSIQNRVYPGTDATTIHNQTKYTSPIDMPLRNPDGSVSATATVDNPWGMATQSGYRTMYLNTLQGTFSAKWDLSRLVTEGLSISGKFSFDNYNEAWTIRNIDFIRKQYLGTDPLTGEEQYKDVQVREGQGIMNSSIASLANRSIYMDAGLNYNRTFGRHTVSGLLIFNRREFVNMLATSELDNIPNRWQGLAGRFTYNFDNRYFTEFNFGYNGSENFPKGSRYGFFPSVSVGWLVSNEPFWHVDVISNLKLRGSYGQVGNDRIQGTRFAYLTTINKVANGYPWGSAATWDSGLQEYKIGTENVTWETANKANIGLDLGLFNDLVALSVDVFHEMRDNIFLQRQSVPLFSGYLSESIPWANLGKVENKGIDAKLEIKRTTASGLYYSFHGTFSFARNKILENDMPPQKYDYLNECGHRMGQVWGLEALGLFQSEEEIAESPVQTFQSVVKPGDIKYKDQNNDGKIDDDDRVAIGYGNIPEIMYGFGGSVGYKGWDLTILFNGAANRSVFLDGAGMMPYALEYPAYNVFREYYDNRYIPYPDADNSNAKYPAVIAGKNSNNYRTSTLYMRDAGYLRLQNVEIGYSFPQKWMERIKIRNIRLFVNGSNLCVFDKIKIMDPEMGQTGTYPKQITLNCGAQIDF